MMSFDDNFVRGVGDRRRRRIRLICECREVRGDRDRDRDFNNDNLRGRYNPWCGCSRCCRERNSEFECRCREISD